MKFYSIIFDSNFAEHHTILIVIAHLEGMLDREKAIQFVGVPGGACGRVKVLEE